MCDDSIRDIQGFIKTSIYEEYNLSPNPVDIILFDNCFIETDIAIGMIFKGKIYEFINNWSMDVNPGYKYIERFSRGITWFMKDSKDVIEYWF